MIAPGICARLDGDEPIAPVVVGDAASCAGEVRVERGVVVVDLVRVPPGSIRLPDLDQLTAERLAVAPEDAAADDDPLAERLTLVLPREVGIAGVDGLFAVGGP